MLSERQIEYLLESCEARLGRTLSELRERLLRDRNHASVIWELVLLHTLLGRFTRVEHEPGPGMPDVIVRGAWLSRLNVEAAVVTSPSAAELRRSSRFHRWLYREIVEQGIQTNGAHISLQARGKEEDAEVPDEHRWGAMQRDPSWHLFTSQLREHGQATWLCPHGNLAVHFKTQQNGYTSVQPLVSALPTDIKKHPVYREVRKKARQISDWPWLLRIRPIMLCICIPEYGPEFSEYPSVHDYSVRRAVFSALLDHDRMKGLDRVNVLRQRLKFFPGGVYVEGNRLRVSGSELISAVMIVRIKQDQGFVSLLPKSTAKADLYVNEHARHPIPERVMSVVRQLDFNSVEYGPGRESWHNTARGSMKLRNLRRGGMLEFRSGKNGGVEVRIPTMSVLAILAGERTAQEAFSGYEDRPPNPLSFFQKALASELTLEAVEIVQADPTTRSEQQIAFRFGKGKPAVIARAIAT